MYQNRCLTCGEIFVHPSKRAYVCHSCAFPEQAVEITELRAKLHVANAPIGDGDRMAGESAGKEIANLKAQLLDADAYNGYAEACEFATGVAMEARRKAEAECEELKVNLAHRDSKCALSTCDERGIHSPFGVRTEGCFCFCAEHAQMFKNAWVPRTKLAEAEEQRDDARDRIPSPGDGSCDRCGAVPSVHIPTSLCPDCMATEAERDKLEAEYAALREVLEWYAESGRTTSMYSCRSDAESDNGERARTALAANPAGAKAAEVLKAAEEVERHHEHERRRHNEALSKSVVGKRPPCDCGVCTAVRAKRGE